ncbi:hypothetical protein Zm00014a_009418, partial [Zea mays]
LHSFSNIYLIFKLNHNK